MIAFNDVSKQYGRQVLFLEASFQIDPGQKIGLVGPNGSGKTTMFRLILGEESPDRGEVSVPRRLSIAYRSRAGPWPSGTTSPSYSRPYSCAPSPTPARA